MKTRILSFTLLALAASLTFSACGDKKEDSPAPAGDGVGSGNGTVTVGSTSYNLVFTQALNTSGQIGAQGSYAGLGSKSYTIQILVYNGTDPGNTSTTYTVASESSGAVYAEAIISETTVAGAAATTKVYRAPDGTKIKYSVVGTKKVLSVPVTTMEEVANTPTGATLSAGGSVAWQ